jgi:hypothetical protein
MEVTAMTAIAENDIVRLTRDINHELLEGLVGIVLQCHHSSFDVLFPIPGKNLQAQLLRKDIEFLVGSKSLEN